VKAAYAESSWNKINSALNAFKKFCVKRSAKYELPIARQFFLLTATTSNKSLKIKVIGNWKFRCCDEF
jgi:hypothetical protein